MGRFKKVISNIKKLDQWQILFDVLSSSEIQQFIIDLNLGQLAIGENTEGDLIGFYKSFTYSSFKQGLPGRKAGFGVVDLRVTGDYWDSYVIKLQKNADFIIDSDPIKDNKNLITIYGPGIEGLSDTSIMNLGQKILRPYVKETKKQILQ